MAMTRNDSINLRVQAVFGRDAAVNFDLRVDQGHKLVPVSVVTVISCSHQTFATLVPENY
jgi:hypothetical protein